MTATGAPSDCVEPSGAAGCVAEEAVRDGAGEAADGGAWDFTRDERDVAALSQAWLDLARRSRAGLFVTPQWTMAWRATIAPEAAWRLLVNRDARGRVRAVWPLALRVRRRGPLRWRELSPMGGEVASGDRLDPLASAPVLAAEAVAAARRLSAGEVDVWRWGEISHGGDADREIGTTRCGRCRLVRDRRPIPTRPLPDSEAAFLGELSGNLRWQTRRKRRRAEDGLGLRWRLDRAGASLVEGVEELMRLHGLCWRARGGTGNFLDGRLAAFVRRFCDAAGEQDWVRLHRLCDGGRAVAAMLVFHFGGRAYYYQSGWDPRAAELSPGLLCLAQAIRTAIEEGVRVFDFLRGDEAYKRHWATVRDETHTIVEPATLMGRLAVAAERGRDWIGRGARRVAGEAAWEQLRRWRRGRAVACVAHTWEAERP